MKLSVVIPVYNVESTLQRCVESVLNQSFSDFEVILVDDGSSDDSGTIADTWAAKDNRIVVVHQANQGLSEARNTGIEIAKGEYITFVDSDDFIGEDTYTALMDVLENNPDYDFLEYSVVEYYNAPFQRHLHLVDKVYNDTKSYWLESKVYKHAYACNKIYKKKIFTKIRYPKGKTFEDALTLPWILEECKVVATTHLGTYFYCYNAAGITTNATGEDLDNLFNAHLQYMSRTNNMDLHYYAYLLNIQLDVYESTGKEPVLPVLPYYSTFKLKLLHLIGLKNLCRLNRLIHKIRQSH